MTKKKKNLKEQLAPYRGEPTKPGTGATSAKDPRWISYNFNWDSTPPKDFGGMIQWDWEIIDNACFQVVQVISYDEGNPNDYSACNCGDPVITESLANKTLINQRNFIARKVRNVMSEQTYKK